MNYQPKPDESTRTTTNHLCVHCGEDMGIRPRMFCNLCGNKAGRDKMHEENEKLGIKCQACNNPDSPFNKLRKKVATQKND